MKYIYDFEWFIAVISMKSNWPSNYWYISTPGELAHANSGEVGDRRSGSRGVKVHPREAHPALIINTPAIY